MYNVIIKNNSQFIITIDNYYIINNYLQKK